MRLALDRCAGVQETRNDRGIDVGDITFKGRRAVHHRHAGDADIVLDGDRFAFELAARRARNVSLYVPGVERILLGARPIPGRARIFDDGNLVGHLIDDIVSGKAAVHQRNELADAFLRHRHAEALNDVRHLFDCWALYTHEFSPFPVVFTPHVGGLVAYSDKFIDEAMPMQFAWFSGMHDDAFLDDEDSLGQSGDEVEILLDKDDRQFALGPKAEKRLRDLVDDRRLNAFGRFVQQKQPWVAREAAGDCEQLLLATRERAARAVDQRLKAREGFQRRSDRGVFILWSPGCARPQVIAPAEARKDVPPLRHMPQAAARTPIRLRAGDVSVFQHDPPCGRRNVAHQRTEERGLAHPVVAKDADELPSRDTKTYAPQDRDTAITGSEVADLQHHAAGFFPR